MRIPLSCRCRPGELLLENAHDHVVVPAVIHVCRLSFPALLGESASQVAANRSLVEGEYAEIDAMQSQSLEAEPQDEVGHLSAKAAPEQLAIQ